MIVKDNAEERVVHDNEILDLYFARDEKALAETAAKYGAYIFTVAHNILGTEEDSEECVNDTYLNTWNAIPPKRPDIFRLFLAKIARHLAINRYNMGHAAKRGSGQMPAVLDELAEVVAGTSDPEGEVVAGELREKIDGFVRTLGEREANLFIRRYFYAEPVEEIAVRYGLTQGNVSVILHRTRNKLRAYLEKEGLLS